MGLDAQIIAIGPYSPEVSTSLEYGTALYDGIATGVTVVSNVFIACTSDDSHQLAAAFGVGAMELGKHQLNPHSANIAQLIAMFGDHNVAQFQCLAQHGFDFFYLPHA